MLMQFMRKLRLELLNFTILENSLQSPNVEENYPISCSAVDFLTFAIFPITGLT